ncbi:hypothetical protein IT084_12705 [Desulfallas sp. Bu1-1]|uniref:hypothetical protein n=1 Tax=Desulfallas sp. Bu1-1 TaxID=2787620 RepID=UPI00189D4723|nr:hypothetical protein [Desulfallas sp. Bu1-1]MBF7083833.1 hypothetical protein [Desulfallas sp. Bu1-1]
MKFCLISLLPPSKLDGEIFTHEVNQISQWATIMGGTHYNGVSFDLGYYGLPYDFFSEFDLVMVALRSELIEVGIKIKERSTARVVVFFDAELEHFTSFLNRELQVRFVRLLNLADAVAVHHENHIPVIKRLTNKPVGVVGLPFPLRKVREELCPPVDKKTIIDLGSALGNLVSRNGLVNLAVLTEIGVPGAADMQDPVELYYLRIMRKYMPIPPIHFRMTSYNPFSSDNRVRLWEEYISQVNYSMLGIHLDFRQTWGRFPIDCAAVRMPCISTPGFYAQQILFPDLCVQYQDVEGAAGLAKRLLKSRSFYEEVMDYAESRLSFFAEAETKQRLLNLLG